MEFKKLHIYEEKLTFSHSNEQKTDFDYNKFLSSLGNFSNLNEKTFSVAIKIWFVFFKCMRI